MYITSHYTRVFHFFILCFNYNILLGYYKNITTDQWNHLTKVLIIRYEILAIVTW